MRPILYFRAVERPEYVQTEALHGFIAAALQEDVGEGDHSSLAAIPAHAEETAQLWAKDAGILAGVALAQEIFTFVDSSLRVQIHKHDGTAVRSGDLVLEVSGKARAILTAERLVLNCMQRMSGIATYTQQVVRLLAGTSTRVLDTRKTTPNFRMMEKWAVAIGGGTNHRFGLYDLIMLKDNHVDYAGGIAQAIQAADTYRKRLQKPLRIEVETRTLEEVAEALATDSCDVIMFDNMDIDTLKQAVALVAGRVVTEASGGITLETVAEVARCGVDYVSMGALTYGATPLDLSLKAKK